jgi:TANFOR domain-containing protein
MQKMKFNYRALLLAVCLLIGGVVRAGYPVQVVPQLLPPYSLTLSDYYTGSVDKLVVLLTNLDLSRSSLSVRLRITISGQNATLTSKDNVYYPAITLDAGVPVRISGSELAPYFNPENLDFQGITKAQYQQSGKLPEGFYQFCVQAIETTTGRAVSQSSCAMAWLSLSDPPLLNMPATAANVVFRDPLNLLFSWTPRNMSSPNSAFSTEYFFQLIEISDPAIDPAAAFQMMPVLYETTVATTTFLYGPGLPPLLNGKKYAWRVQAHAKSNGQDLDLYRNNGYSEVNWFLLQDNCLPPLQSSATIQGGGVHIDWIPQSQMLGYEVDYRVKGRDNANWFTQLATEDSVVFYDVKPGQSYEYRIGGSCSVTGGTVYGDVHGFTVPAQDPIGNPNCGILPNINITNQTMLPALSAGDVFKAGDFPVKVLQVAGRGSFSGDGYVTVPFLGQAMVRVKFSQIGINTDRQLISGVVVTAFDASMKQVANADTVIKMAGTLINDIKGLVSQTQDFVNAYTGSDAQKKEADSLNNLIGAAYDSLQASPYLTSTEKQQLAAERVVNQQGLNGLAGKDSCDCGTGTPSTSGPAAFRRWVITDINCCKKNAATEGQLTALAQTASDRQTDLTTNYQVVSSDDDITYYPIDPAGHPLILPAGYWKVIRAHDDTRTPHYVVSGFEDQVSKKMYMAVMDRGVFGGYHLSGQTTGDPLPVQVAASNVESPAHIEVYMGVNNCAYNQYRIDSWDFDIKSNSIVDESKIAELVNSIAPGDTKHAQGVAFSNDVKGNPITGCQTGTNTNVIQPGDDVVDYSQIPGGSGFDTAKVNNLRTGVAHINSKLGVHVRVYLLNKSSPTYNDQLQTANNDTSSMKIIVTYDPATRQIKLDHKFTAPAWMRQIFPAFTDQCTDDYVNKGLDELHKSLLYQAEDSLSQAFDEIKVMAYRAVFGFLYCATNEKSAKNANDKMQFFMGALNQVVATFDVEQMVNGIVSLATTVVSANLQGYEDYYNDLKNTLIKINYGTPVSDDDLLRLCMPPEWRAQAALVKKGAHLASLFYKMYFSQCDKYKFSDGTIGNVCAYRKGQLTVMIIPIVLTAGEYAMVKTASLIADLQALAEGSEDAVRLMSQAESAGETVAATEEGVVASEGNDPKREVVMDKDDPATDAGDPEGDGGESTTSPSTGGTGPASTASGTTSGNSASTATASSITHAAASDLDALKPVGANLNIQAKVRIRKVVTLVNDNKALVIKPIPGSALAQKLDQYIQAFLSKDTKLQGELGEEIAGELAKEVNPKGSVVNVKSNGSGHGFDIISFEEDNAGNLTKIRIIESKPLNSDMVRLPLTTDGTQMSRQWRQAKIGELLQSSDPALQALGEKLFQNQPLIEGYVMTIDKQLKQAIIIKL